MSTAKELADDAARRLIRPTEPGFYWARLIYPRTSVAEWEVVEFDGERVRMTGDDEWYSTKIFARLGPKLERPK